MIRKKILVLIAVVFSCLYLYAFDFTELDDKLQDGWHVREVYEQLLDMEGCDTDAQILSRLSQAAVVIGDTYTSSEERTAWFDLGCDYAVRAINADPSVRSSYVWHVANIGRKCQSSDIFSVLHYAEIVQKDLDYLLNVLEEFDYESAWEAMAEYYYNHPFKPNSDAVNYARLSCSMVPVEKRDRGQLWLSAYELLARCLYKRNWSAKKRKIEISAMKDKFEAENGSLTSKYAYYEGTLGFDYVPEWSEETLASCSDRDEARLVLQFCKELYDSHPHSTYDERAWRDIADHIEKWQK